MRGMFATMLRSEGAHIYLTSGVIKPLEAAFHHLALLLVWATTYLRKQSEAHAQQLDEAMGRIAEEETYQGHPSLRSPNTPLTDPHRTLLPRPEESMRQNLLRVKKQVQDAMEHLAGMQSLALVRVHQRSESAEPRSTSGRKKARTQ